MTRFVVDASVAVKWFLAEEHSGEAKRLLVPEHELVAPGLLEIEFSNALVSRLRRNLLSIEEVRGIMAQFKPLVEFRDDTGLAQQAIEIAARFDRTAYDALYVAAALDWDMRLVTADRRLYNAVAAEHPASLVWIEDVPAA